MLYYFDEAVNWNKKVGRSEIENEVYEGMQAIKNKFFADNTLKKVRLIYPKGKPEEVHKVFGVLKKYPIDLKSADGVWRWSKGRANVNKEGIVTYSDHHFMVTHSTVFGEKDIELVWFLTNKSTAIKSGKIYIENLEEEAAQKAEVLSEDADIRYMLYGKNSPISKDEKLIRNVAEIFGLRDVEKRGVNEVRNDLYEALVNGEKRKDRFVNFKTFEELTEGNTKRKAAFHARRSINDGIVGYKDRAWYLKEGREYAEELMRLKAQEVEDRVELFIQEVINNPNVRNRLFSAIGLDEEMTADDLWEMDRPTLLRMANEQKCETTNKDKKEELVEKLCAAMNIKYKPKPA